MTPAEPWLAFFAWGLLVFLLGLEVLIGWVWEWWERPRKEDDAWN